jgi:8-oxo-dGTP pyrophosphatase MutT (NUDIX family)
VQTRFALRFVYYRRDIRAEERNAVVTLTSRLVYEGRIFDVTVDRVRLPHGPEADLELVRHDGSVVLIPIADDGRLLLVRQYRHAAGRHLWELPAGSLEAGEDPDAAAARECHEELGLIPDRLERLLTLYPTPGFCTETMTYYRAMGLRAPGPDDAPAHQDEDESIEVGAFTVDEIRAMVARGEIADLKTVAALALGSHGRSG